MERFDVVVVGGGAMGSAAAWQLARRGRDVLVCEQFGPGHVRGSSHGASRIFRLAYPDPFYVELARRSLGGWRELADEAGSDPLTLTGSVDHGPPAAISPVVAALAACGVASEELSGAAAAERWPMIRFAERVVFHPDGGLVNADEAVAALQRTAARRGAQVRHHCPVRGFRAEPGGFTLDLPTGRVRAGRVVVAAGSWTGRFLAGRVALPPLTVTREQPAYFAPRAQGGWPSFLHYAAAVAELPADFVGYGTFTPGHGVKVGLHRSGGPWDPDDPPPPPDPAAAARLAGYVREWVPGVDPDRAEPTSCLYTVTPDEDFVVDRVGDLTVAAGFSGHGFKFTPEIGRLVAELALDDRPAPARFRLGR